MSEKSYSLLRVFTDEVAMSGDRRLFEVIIERAKRHKLLGLTLIRCQVGFGHSVLLHVEGILDHNYPLIIEIIDEEDRLCAFADEIRGMHGIGLITTTEVNVISGGRNEGAFSGT